MSHGGTFSAHCSECGSEVEESCADHPRATIETIFVSHTQKVRDDAIAEGRIEEAVAVHAELNGVPLEIARRQVADLIKDQDRNRG